MPKSRLVFISILILIVLAGVAIWWYTNPTRDAGKKIPPLAVETATVKTQPMPVVLQTIGTIEPQQSVTILPQVTGTVQKVNIQEGQAVTVGQLLVEIDPTPLEISLRQAKADLARNQAQIANLSNTAERFKKLLKLGYVSLQQYEQAEGAANAQLALVSSDKEAVQQAETQLAYTKIKAPISGKTGNINVKVGDLVTANTTALFTINQLDPIYVDFSVPQNQLSTVLSYQAKSNLTVEVKYTNIAPPLVGKLIFIDNNVNPLTGTVALKAAINNAANTVWPGQTVPVRLILTVQQDAIVVPSIAVQIDQTGNFVYILEGKKAKLRHVTVNRQLDGLSVISKGLTGTETVLTTIPPNLTDGSTVKVVKNL